jgi:hypothetical protein
MRTPRSWVTWLLLGGVSAGAFALMAGAMSYRPSRSPEQVLGPQGGIFTPGHSSLGSAVADFFDIRPTPVQPIAFTHKVHLEKNLTCPVCHTGVTQGPQAGIPSAKFCMACHMVIAADKPEIKKLTAYVQRGEDVPWQRVYGFSQMAHVRFNHAPHIRAGVECSSCHGDLAQQTVAVRSVNLNMGYCLSCHLEKKASVDCQTCHY